MGARMLRSWLLAPLVDPAAISARLDAWGSWSADARGRDRCARRSTSTRRSSGWRPRAWGVRWPRELARCGISISPLPDVAPALDGLEARGQASLLEEARTASILLQDLGDELARASSSVRRPKRPKGTDPTGTI